MKRLSFALLLFVCSCRQGDTVRYSGSYFDLKGYLEKEAVRLKSALVDKTVSKNSNIERRRMKIRSWASELSLFSESDINKPAWKNSYKTTSSKNKIIYTALESNLRTRSIEIVNTSGQVESITINNRSNNTLYNSSERLEYFPDSLYRIEKKQKVVVIGTNNYTVTGRIIK